MELKSAGLHVPRTVLEKLSRYCEQLDHWNKRINLTALTGAALVRRLIVEPMWIGGKLNMSGSLLDIGSGNGSPALPLCISRNLSPAHLVEARARRAAFLRHVIALVQVHAEVHRGRFEDELDNLPTADWITLQAVFPTPELLNAMKRISKPATSVLWITSERNAVAAVSGTRLQTPFADTTALVFNPQM